MANSLTVEQYIDRRERKINLTAKGQRLADDVSRDVA